MGGGAARRYQGRAVLLTAAALLFVAGDAGAACLPLVCKFSVSGKKGSYLRTQVTSEQLASADAAAASKVSGGRSLAEQSINRGELAGAGLHLPQTEKALEVLLAKLAGAWPHRRPPPVTLRIVGSTDFNPSARPDNVIVIPLGVLMRANSDDEVAWVLAHEYSHIALAHFAREARQRRLKSAVGGVVSALQTGADMAQQRADTSGERVRFYTVSDPKAERFSHRVWARSRGVATGLEILNQNTSRKQEDQADVAAVDLVLVSGYADSGAGDALDKLDEDEKRLAASLTTMEDELGRVTNQAAARAVDKLNQGKDADEVMSGVFEDLKRNVTRMLLNKVIEAAQSSHRPAAVRKRGVGDYLDAAYPDLSPRQPSTAWLDAIRRTPEFRDARTAVEARDRALAKLAADAPPDEAWTELQPALQTRHRTAPFISNIAARIWAAKGDNAQADRAYDLAERSPASVEAPTARARARPAKGAKGRNAPAPSPQPPPPTPDDLLFRQSLDGFRDHVRLLVKMGNFPKALAVVAEAKRRFGDDEAFLPFLVTIYARTRKPELLVESLARCMETEDETLRQQCQVALLSDEQLKSWETMTPADQAKVYAVLDKAATTSRRVAWWQTIASQIGKSED